jgi:hypothetical protein
MTPRCPYRIAQHVCRAPMVERRDPLTGRLGWHCEACARRRRGVCRCCPRRVAGIVGRALYCASCRQASKRATTYRWYQANPEAARSIARRSARKRYRGRIAPDPAVSARQRAARLRLAPERRQELARLGGLGAARRSRKAA